MPKAKNPTPEQQARYREISRRNQRKARGVNFPLERVRALRELQEGRCGICTVPMLDHGGKANSQCGDHCHADGHARGLICYSCNLGLGRYEKYQRPAGLRLDGYEAYLNRWMES